MKKDSVAASLQIIHAPCAFNPKGATRETCDRMTHTARHNHEGCVAIQCKCNRRVCRVCVTQASEPEFVSDYSAGLCSFHKEHGESARRDMKKPAPAQPAWARALREASMQRPQPVVHAQNFPIVQKEVPKVIKLPAAPARATAPKRASFGGGRPKIGKVPIGLKVWDSENNQTVRMFPFALLSVMEGLKQQSKTASEIAQELRVGELRVSQLFRLERVVMEVRELESVHLLSVGALIQLSALKPEFQLGVAEDLLNKRLSNKGLKLLLRDPEKKSSGRLKGVRRRQPTSRRKRIRMINPVTGARELQPAESVLTELLRLRDEEGFHPVEAGKRLGFGNAYARLLFKLEHLVPEVRELLSADKYLPLNSAFVIAAFAPERQLDIAQQVLDGTLALEALRSLLAEPGNRRERRRVKASRAVSRKGYKKPLLHAVAKQVGRLEKSVEATIQAFGVIAIQERDPDADKDEELEVLKERVRNVLRELRLV